MTTEESRIGEASDPRGALRPESCSVAAFETFPFEVPVSSLPLHATGLPDPWHPLQRWAPDSIASRHGEVLVPLARGREGNFGYHADRAIGESPAAFDIFEVPLAEAVERVKYPRGRDLYAMKQVSLDRSPPGLRQEAPCPSFLAGRGHLSWLWISGDHTRTCLHFDRANGLIVQLQGSKKITLAPPEETERIPLHPERSASAHGSDLDLASEAARRLRRIEVLLDAGQALLLPAFWFHQVENLGVSVSVHYSWRPSIPQRLLAPARRLAGHDFSANRLRSLRTQLTLSGDLHARDYASQSRERGDEVAAALVLLADWEEMFFATCPGAANADEVFARSDLSAETRADFRWILQQVGKADQRPLTSPEAASILSRLASAQDLRPKPSHPYAHLGSR